MRSQQEGVAAFELVARIRKLSVASRRHADHEADRALKSRLKSPSGDEGVRVVRLHLLELGEMIRR